MSIYAKQSDVEPLIKFISDTASTDLYNSVLSNADSWVNARLLSNSLSIWTSHIVEVEDDSELQETELQNEDPELQNEEETETTEETTQTTITPEIIEPIDKPIPDLLKTAAVYYAASDIILALYNGEEMPTQYDTYFQKAESMLEAYINQMKRELAETDLKKYNPVKHSKSASYYQRKHRRPRA